MQTPVPKRNSACTHPGSFRIPPATGRALLCYLECHLVLKFNITHRVGLGESPQAGVVGQFPIRLLGSWLQFFGAFRTCSTLRPTCSVPFAERSIAPRSPSAAIVMSI